MYGHGCWDPCGMGYAAPAYAPAPRGGAGFALIVVLFILLIIVGAAWYNPVA